MLHNKLKFQTLMVNNFKIHVNSFKSMIIFNCKDWLRVCEENVYM